MLRVGMKRLSFGLTIKRESGGEVDLIPFDETQRIGFNGEVFGLGLRDRKSVV